MNDSSGVITPQEGAGLVAAVLRDPEIEIIGHNIAFDFHVLTKVDPTLEPLIWAAYDEGRIYDTMIAAQMDDIARGCFMGSRKGFYTLQALTERYLQEHLEKEDTWRLRYGELVGIPIAEWPREAVEYARKDAIAPVRIRREIKTVATGDAPDLRRQCAYAWALHLMARRGLRTDPQRVQLLFDRITSEASEIVKHLMPLGWLSYDKGGVMHRHPGKVQEYMRGLGVAGKKTAKGRISVDAEACDKSGDIYLQSYSHLGRLLDCINKDASYLCKPEVRCNYGLAESGRTTCWGPNLQNLKTENFSAKDERPILGVRECFVPREGYVFAVADYDGLELRTMAQACLAILGQSRLAEMLNAGADPHCNVASEMLGMPYDQVREIYKDKTHPDYERIYRARQCGKVANFGFPGGLGFKRMVGYAAGPKYQVTLTEKDAQELKAIWLRTFPEFREYFQVANKVVSMGEPLEQVFSGRLRGGVSFCEGANSWFQGLGGDATKAAVYELTKECRIGVMASHPVVFVHDEIICEVPEECGHEAAETMGGIMRAAADQFLPDVPSKTEPFLMRRWSKLAEKKVDEQGRLVPWDS
jgi:DNA polymerase I-like protein with 3'-5' exonuclease and polymerase domains